MIKTPTIAAQNKRFTLACSSTHSLSQQGESARQETEEVGNIATSEKKVMDAYSCSAPLFYSDNPGPQSRKYSLPVDGSSYLH